MQRGGIPATCQFKDPVQSGDIRQVTTNLQSTSQLYFKDGSFTKEKRRDPTKVVKRSLGEQLSEETFRNFVALPSRNRGSDNKSVMHQQQPSWLLCLRSQEFISSRIAEKLELHV